jgi:hypothetical protein
MRKGMSAVLATAALVTATPVHAEWKSYINRELCFAFRVPGEVKTDIGTFRGAVAGPRETIIYKSVDNNIEYKVTVMSFLQAQAEGATIRGEREYVFQQGKKVLADTFGRVEPGKDAVYSRKLIAELPDHKGRTTAAFYFTKGLISLEATVLPANGDFGSPLPPSSSIPSPLCFPVPSPARSSLKRWSSTRDWRNQVASIVAAKRHTLAAWA